MNDNQHDNRHSHDIDDLFRSAIEPAGERPPSLVWESVEKDLDRENIISIKRKYDNLKKIAIALVLLLSSTLIYEFQHHHNINKTGQGGSNINDELTSSGNAVKNRSGEKQDAGTTTRLNTSQFVPIDQSTVTSGIQDVDVMREQSRGLLPSKNDSKTSYQDKFVITGGIHGEPLSFMESYQKGSGNNSIKEGEAAGLNGGVSNLTSLIKFPSAFNHQQAAVALTTAPDVSADIFRFDNSLATKNWPAGHVVSEVSKQSLKLSQKRTSRFLLSLIFSPDFTTRLVKEDWPINREDNRDEIRKSEHYAFSYSIGALVDYRLSDHWAIQSGFTLSRAVMNIAPKFIFARTDALGDVKYKFNSSSGYSYLSPHTMTRPSFGDSLHAFGSSTSLQYISIPVSAKYKISGKKFDFYASAGVAANILVKDKIETSLFNGGNHENTVDHDIKGLKPAYFSGLIAAGVSYNISKTLAVSLTPTARLAITSINKDVPVRSYQQSWGMVAGVQMGF